MSGLKLAAAFIAALSFSTVALAGPAGHFHHHHHHVQVVGPGIVGPNWDLYGPGAATAPVYGGPYSTFSGGEPYGWGSGGINSMGNDFGTSGVLGHTNGMPATGH